MKAVYQEGWGATPIIRSDMPKPQPSDTSVLVAVKAVSIHQGDYHQLSGRPYMIRLAVGRREIPGMDFAGVVVEPSGEFAAGDEVLGTADVACGAWAEFVSVPAAHLIRKPPEIDWPTAAALPTSGMTALQATRLGRPLSSESKVLVNGASGGVGHFAVQIVKASGAHVTAVCSSKNEELVRSLGADEVIDYSVTTVEEASKAKGTKYDKIIDTAGRPNWRPLLTPNGEWIAVALPYHGECVPCHLCSVLCFPNCCCCLSSQKGHAFMQEVKAADMEELASMVVKGDLKPHLGHTLAGMEELPGALEAHSRVGKTVVTFGGVELSAMDRA